MRTPILLCLMSLSTVAAAAPPRGAPVELTYLGTAGWQIRAGDVVVLLDPYYSRVPWPKDGGRIAPDAAAIARHAPARAALVLVSHSHWDHLLDAAEVAKRTGAQVVGSASTVNYARGSGVAEDHVIPVRGGEDYAFGGGLSVRVIPSLHSALRGKHWADDEVIRVGAKPPMTLDEFHPDRTFAFLVRIGGRELLFVSSANFIERELAGLTPDVLIAAPGLREEIHDYSCRLVRAAGQPKLVLATHFDEFTVPYAEAKARHAETAAAQKGFVDEIRGCAPGTEVRIPRHLEAIAVP
jgi:L-ascorbate metabolism protein UlaG (beta-lactamase superfamily)